MKEQRKHSGDRKDGRLLRSLPAFTRIIPFIMPTHNDGCSYYPGNYEVSSVENWLQEQHNRGYKDLGMIHFIVAAYVRCVAMLPGINRFVAGRRIYARDKIEIVLPVKREYSTDASETTVKVEFEPTDTVFDVYRKINAKIDEIKTNNDSNNTDDVADVLSRFPRFLLRFIITILKVLDYFGWLPDNLTNPSPFHGSMMITDLGSFNVGPMFHHIYNFGTLPVFFSLGEKREAVEVTAEGRVVKRKYLGINMTLDDRICDSYYFSRFLKAFHHLFNKPEILENPPIQVVPDIK